MLKNRKRRMITLPFDLDETLVKQAEKEHRPVTNLIEKIIIDYLNHQNKEDNSIDFKK